MDRYILDLRGALRSLARARGTALIAVAALAMGIGFTTTMFSIVHGGTRALPFAEPEELLIVTRTLPRIAVDNRASAFDYQQWSAQQHSFEGLGAFTTSGVNLSGDGERAGRYEGASITPGAFGLLGIAPLIGRGFQSDDAAPGAARVLILSHALWTQRFSGDPGVLGRSVRVDGEAYTVIGVMPAGFRFPIASDVWVPLGFPAGAQPAVNEAVYTVFGRLRDDVDAARAAVEMATIADRLRRAYPDSHGEAGIRVFPFTEMETPREVVSALYIMVGAASLVLLIACANVANLLLARAASRTHDTAIRTALGASRRRVMAAQLVEAVALTAIGGLLGLLFAWLAVRFFRIATAHIIEAFWVDFRVDTTVVLFATALGFVAAVAAGLAPALRSSALDVSSALKDRPGGSSSLRIGRLSRMLLGTQVATACGLLIVTAVLVRSAMRLHATEFPYDTRTILAAQLGFPFEELTDVETRNQRLRVLDERIRAVPGVAASAFSSVVPGRGSGRWSFQLDAPTTQPGEALPWTGVTFIAPGYLDVLDAAPLAGRDIGWHDGADAPGVALVNEQWVARYSPDRDPLGRTLHLASRMFRIVGVVPDLVANDIEEVQQHGVYIPMMQSPYATSVRFMARSNGDPMMLVPGVRAAIEAVEPDVPFFEIASLRDAIFMDKRVLDALGTLFFVFGLGALFLTVVGLYGVVSFAVGQRTREIGIRVALGAGRREVTGLVLRQGSRPVALGVAAGLLLAFAMSTVLAAAVEPVEPAGVTVFLGVVAVITGTALVSLFVPARRALSVEPVKALRME